MAGMFPFKHPFWSGSDYWDWPASSRIFDQQFALEPVRDLLRDPFFDMSTHFSPYWMRPRRVDRIPSSPDDIKGVSEVKNEPQKFTVNMDVSQFLPEELKIKTVDNMVVIDGKHDEKMDEHGFISRSFTRKYILPKEVDPETVVSRLSPKGVLTIEAPKKAIADKPTERTVPIHVSSQPAVEAKDQ
ncbi:unnamed protein product [Soboliphyme baturini]|uniref:SHSP domain-containing protein n=1 Tax=Soboliphyme baturini TaxID=241478 RepID=A0A183ILY3_9BILA|nr:unnamed protein product [Soboliphyme baturini]